MYFTSLPDHSKPGFDEQLHFSKFGQHNIIFNAVSGQSYCDRHAGCLSIKTVSSGEEWYGIGGRQVAVRPGQFLVLNNHQEYSSRIDTLEKTRVLSVFFGHGFASSVFRDAVCQEETLVDNPFESSGACPEFFQTLTGINTNLRQQLLGLVTALNYYGYDSNMVDEHLVFLLRHLMEVHKTAETRASRVSAIKPNTRTEIYKRLCMAKDLLHSTFMDKPDLSVISKTACLSTPQLIRHFKLVFQTTPHQYLTCIRLGHAAAMLKHTTESVNEITWKCGFEDTSAFCRAFKAEYGVSPMIYRMQS